MSRSEQLTVVAVECVTTARQLEDQAAQLLGLGPCPTAGWVRGRPSPRTLWLQRLRSAAQRAEDVRAGQLLLEAHRLYWRLVDQSDWWLAHRLGRGATDSRMQHLREVALHAAELFDPGHGTQWLPYLKRWISVGIHARMNREHLPMLGVSLYRRRPAVLRSLPPSPSSSDFERVAEYHGMTVDAVRRIVDARPLDSMDRPLLDGRGPTVGDCVATPGPSPDAVTDRLDAVRVLSGLGLRAAYTVVRYLGLLDTTPLTFEDIAADLGVSRAAVQQLYKGALQRMGKGQQARDALGEESLPVIVLVAALLDGQPLSELAAPLGLDMETAHSLAKTGARELLRSRKPRGRRRRRQRPSAQRAA